MTLQTEFEFVLPVGYVDEHGVVHRRGIMRRARGSDELEPLRDGSTSGPDDPRLTILVLARTVETLGTLTLVTPHEIEGLFVADLAYLQDFYSVINFGTEENIAALLAAQREMENPTAASTPSLSEGSEADGAESGGEVSHEPGSPLAFESKKTGRRSAIEEVSSGGR